MPGSANLRDSETWSELASVVVMHPTCPAPRVREKRTDVIGKTYRFGNVPGLASHGAALNATKTTLSIKI
jgi:hypothetical protein